MLKRIPGCIPPALMEWMMRMGHGDTLVLADADFPADTLAKRVVRADGVSLLTLLDAILPFYPLDPFVAKPAAVMAQVDGAEAPEVLRHAAEHIRPHEQAFDGFEYVERHQFYERAKAAFAVVVTGEPDGNMILQKGVVNL